MKRFAALTVLGVAAATLVGQGGLLTTRPTTVASSAPTTAPTTKPTTAPTSQPSKGLTALELHRTGGFAGTDDKLTIAPDGTYKTTGKLLGIHDGKLDKETADSLQKATEAANITADKEYKPDERVMDGFAHELTVSGHKVKWQDTAKLPEKLQALVEVLNQIIVKAAADQERL